MQFETVETDRLRIRRFRPDDWAGVHAYASDAATNTYLGVGVMTEEQCRAWVDRQSGDEWAGLAVALRLDDSVIGHLILRAESEHRTREIGWVIHERARGQGYATEAARALLRHCFETLDLHRVFATCQPENVASWRVMEKLGMRREGHFHRSVHQESGEWWDEYLYAILQEEWSGH
jgi:RimJ/RimL family protein N-acetyltransferase